LSIEELINLQEEKPNEGEPSASAFKSFAACHQRMCLDIVLSLSDAKGKSSSGKLHLRIQKLSTSQVTQAVMHKAKEAHEALSPPRGVQAAEKMDQINSSLSGPTNPISSFESLLGKVGTLVKLGDEIAKVWAPFSRDLLIWVFKC